MIKFFRIFIPFFLFLVVCNFVYAVKAKVYIFTREGCPACEEEKKFLKELKSDKNLDFEVIEYDTSQSQNKKLLEELEKENNWNSRGMVPFTVIGDKTFSGFSRSPTGDQIKQAIEEFNKSGGSDKIAEKNKKGGGGVPKDPGSGGDSPGGGGSGGSKRGETGESAERKNITYKPEVPVGKMGEGDITGTSIAVYIRGLATFAISVVGIVAAFIVMWAGFVWLVAGGNQQKIGEAKNWLFGALFGLVLALGSYVILETINPALVEIKSITPSFESEGIKAPDEYVGKEKEEGGESNKPEDKKVPEKSEKDKDKPKSKEGEKKDGESNGKEDENGEQPSKGDTDLERCMASGYTREQCEYVLDDLKLEPPGGDGKEETKERPKTIDI